MHPFDTSKYRRIHDGRVRQGMRSPNDFVRPQLPTREEMRLVHTEEYLRSLWRGLTLAKILEVWVAAVLPAVFTRWRVLRPMRLATGGTILACRLALEHGLAVNLGGGFHHANGSHGHGFCVYADAPTALAVLHREGRIRKALIVDADAHQGDGNADAVRNWGWVRVLDFFEERIFPRPKVAEDLPVPLPSLLTGADYLKLLHEHLQDALRGERPDLIVYNAGSDVLATDPLTSLLLTPEDLAARDHEVVGAARQTGIPVAMVLSGGYGPLSWQAHARSIANLVRLFDPTC
jgi:histone deacetylase 11